MVIRECLNLRFQRNKSRFTPKKVFHEISTSTPDITRRRVDCREDIEQMLDIRVL